MYISPETTPSERPYFLKELQITDETFSTNFRKDFISWIDFGEPDPTSSTSAPVPINNIPDYFWSTKLDGIRFGEDDVLAFGFELDNEQVLAIEEGVYTLFDTAAPKIFMS